MSGSNAFLVVNCGSTSVRAALFDPNSFARLWSAQAERLGHANATLVLREGDGRSVSGTVGSNHAAALSAVFEALKANGRAGPSAVGHRIVHGGAFDSPQLLTGAVVARLDTLMRFAPLHMPHNLAGIAAARSAWPKAAQVGCFDTVFHRTLPARARAIALPKALLGEDIRRYGFHGLSYEYVVDALARAGVDVARERIVIAHLGAGASLCAVERGKSIETTMGFSTLSGLPMSTRCGDVDPGLLLHLIIERKLVPEELERMLYHDAGLKALSGISGDMKELLARREESNAAFAIDVFCHAAFRHAAGLAAEMGRLDRLVFTGGVGANAPVIRAEICAGLALLGVRIDHGRNDFGARIVSSDQSAVIVEALASDEEIVIARHVQRLMDDA